MILRKSAAISPFLMLAVVMLFSAGRLNATPFWHDHDHDDDDDHGHTLLVDDDKVQCPSATFTTIQSAVLAASSGDRINVCPGTYHEQVKVTKRLTIQGIAVGNQNLAVIMPTGTLVNSSSLTSAAPIAAVVLVDGTEKVNLNNLTVDGSTNGLSGCGINLVGIYYRNSSGDVDNVAVKNIKLAPADFGCQSGLGIFVQSGNNKKSRVDISDSSVHDYQKNGITANEVGTEVNITGNAVTGVGPTVQIAQNGIQLAFGAKGRVEGNSVINHVYSPCTSGDNCAATSSNILIFNSNGVKVSGNNLGNSQVNIYYGGNRGEVSCNTIFQSPIFDGIDLIGNQNKAVDNRIFNSDQSAVFVMGDRNEVKDNLINETPFGVLKEASSTNTSISGNRYYNTGRNVGVFTPSAPFGTSLTGGSQARSMSVANP
jgi:hypothetical protein